MSKHDIQTPGALVHRGISLLLRSLENIFSFTMLWFGISQWGKEAVIFGLPSSVPAMCALIGSGLCTLLIIVNLIQPLSQQKKQSANVHRNHM